MVKPQIRMRKFILLMLILASSFTYGQVEEIKYKLFVIEAEADTIDLKESKINIGTERWNKGTNVQMKWDGDQWVYDDAIVFRDAGFGYAAIDRRGVSYGGMNMGAIGNYAFDISTNWYRTDNPGAVGDLSFCQGTDNKASGYASVAFGYNNTADAHYSFVAGVNNEVGGGGASGVIGAGLDAGGADNLMVVGEANVAPESIGIGGANEWRFIVGIGEVDSYGTPQSKKNGIGVNKNGSAYLFNSDNAVIASHAKTVVTYEFIAGAVPANASAPGSKGQIATDANFIYVCVATDTWVRAPLATW